MRAGTIQPGDKEAQGDLSDVYKYLKGGCREDVVRLFVVVHSDGRKDSGLKLKYREFCLNIRERGEVFTVRVLKLWQKLPREGVECPSLEMFKIQPKPSEICSR